MLQIGFSYMSFASTPISNLDLSVPSFVFKLVFSVVVHSKNAHQLAATLVNTQAGVKIKSPFFPKIRTQFEILCFEYTWLVRGIEIGIDTFCNDVFPVNANDVVFTMALTRSDFVVDLKGIHDGS
jgi:hypothetical protein